MRESRFTQVAKPTYHIAKQALPTYCIAVFVVVRVWYVWRALSGGRR